MAADPELALRLKAQRNQGFFMFITACGGLLYLKVKDSRQDAMDWAQLASTVGPAIAVAIGVAILLTGLTRAISGLGQRAAKARAKAD
mmetsp:Transcript_811/g.2416  ORF Transcript_811/g.2416 Transcript_811/m.2416 type:complete len:88 (+) Transcript_811:70-333(+)